MDTDTILRPEGLVDCLTGELLEPAIPLDPCALEPVVGECLAVLPEGAGTPAG